MRHELEAEQLCVERDRLIDVIDHVTNVDHLSSSGIRGPPYWRSIEHGGVASMPGPYPSGMRHRSAPSPFGYARTLYDSRGPQGQCQRGLWSKGVSMQPNIGRDGNIGGHQPSRSPEHLEGSCAIATTHPLRRRRYDGDRHHRGSGRCRARRFDRRDDRCGDGMERECRRGRASWRASLPSVTRFTNRACTP